ncbi:MAG: tRNA (adenosine(37)-N6)-dimethylallyltransferase MiaA [Bacteroidetes bacterium RIFCSPLOWO2_12_FULL_35_15]|nr:MAG: tRNA (adenosine(37)-N6)-dimethylallyltransferase MiaA [Bacteroidetes bacterium RIFCSPLOWO2_12_FULL_35_15]
MTKKSLIVIIGPTAIGKTSLSIALAKELNCPVISADSRQFFKEMSIGTAKPSKEEMQGVPHYFIDSHSIVEDYNVGKFENEAIGLLEKLFQKHNVVLMVGGSGLYIDAVCKGFDKLPEADAELREKINSIFESKGMAGLQELLKDLDPEYYTKVDLQNRHRVSRAIEVCLCTGKPYSSLREGKNKERNFNSIKVGLNTSREVLYSQINQRVDEMMKQGLLEEVKALQAHKGLNALQTVGYRELFDYLDKKNDLFSAVELIKQNTRNFAKRQLTWFRKDPGIKWFEPDALEEIKKYLLEVDTNFMNLIRK